MIFFFETHRHIGHIVFDVFKKKKRQKLCVLCVYVFQKKIMSHLSKTSYFRRKFTQKETFYAYFLRQLDSNETPTGKAIKRFNNVFSLKNTIFSIELTAPPLLKLSKSDCASSGFAKCFLVNKRKAMRTAAIGKNNQKLK